jgi:hypothetical protein
MAEPGSWPSIRDNGFLSTSALLDRYDVNDASRDAIESERRPECVTITRKGMPDAVIRDQKPMSDGALRKCRMALRQPTGTAFRTRERSFGCHEPDCAGSLEPGRIAIGRKRFSRL